jgi:CheY-like chemotaxis protein
MSDSTTAAGLCILIADDNVDAAESLGLLIELEGHTVHLARDGREALAMAQRLRPQVAILDIGMPGMDGNTVARCIRDSLPDDRMLILAVTGRAQPEDRERTRAAGFDHHFTKPVALGALLGQLVRWRDELNAAAPE